jgi:hypothetical protein
MSPDIEFVVQVAVLMAQVAKVVLDTIERRRHRTCPDPVCSLTWHPAGGCIQAAIPCSGSGCPRPWSARTCGRTVSQRAEGAARRQGRPARRITAQARAALGVTRQDGGQARWDCRGRVRRHPHGRHRRCA